MAELQQHSRFLNHAFAYRLILGVGALAGSAAAAAEPLTAPDGVRHWQILLAMGYLAVVAGIGYFLVRFFKSRGMAVGGLESSTAIQIRSVKRLTPSTQAVLLDISGQSVLVVVAPSGVSTTALEKPDGR